ncbi:MAG TPA: hypothetical protein VG028_07170 [Terriglobia bacterium]|nr:hypothetical protein [Terriglobia bacterium]
MANGAYRRGIGMVVAAILWGAVHALAQAQVGDDWSLNLSGSVSAGYAAGYTNAGPSSHGITFGGNGDLSGSYYSPSFLSFSVSPFDSQSRNNSSYQSISDSTGVTANASIFSGSHFPGHINFSKVYNGEGSYSIPSVANYKTNGNTQDFGVGWAANVPDLPSLSFGYQQGSSEYSVYGANAGNLSDFHALYGNTAYVVDGFHLSGGIHHNNLSSKFPQLMKGYPSLDMHSDSTNYALNMNRSFALNGNTWVSFTRYDYDYKFPGSSNSLSSDVVTGGAALKPMEKLSLQVSGDYDDNLNGTLYQTIIEAGGPVLRAIPGESSHSWGVYGTAQYTVLSGLYVAGTFTHREQLFLGSSYGSNSYGASVNYGRHVLGGQLAAGINLTRSSIGSAGESMTGLLSNVSYFRQLGPWNVSGSFNYSQDVQTFLIAYTTSGYGYSGTVSRRLRRLNWNGTASGSKSLLSVASGSNTFSQSYSTGLSGRWLGVNAGYSHALGSGVFTGAGITPLPPQVPTVVNPTSFIFYGGTSYSFGLGSTPIRGLTINGNYVKTRSNTMNGTVSSNNLMTQGNVFVQYKFRKVYFTSGYSRLLQGFSSLATPPNLVGSYYVGVSRWFSFF